MVFSPVNRTGFYLILLFPLFRLLLVSLLRGGGGAWVEFLGWPWYESVVFLEGLFFAMG